MKIQRVKKIVRQVWDIFHFGPNSVENRDLGEYEKVKKEFRPIEPKNKKLGKAENRDISAI